MMNMSLIKEARERLAQGWCKGMISDKAGNVCASGAFIRAINSARENSVDYDETGWSLFNNVAIEMFPDRAHHYITASGDTWETSPSAVYVNDHPDTTKEDMLSIFDKAIIREEEQV